jgi:hypothetical protein
MMLLIVKDERPKPADFSNMTDQERAELFKTMISYGGTYTFNGKPVTHTTSTFLGIKSGPPRIS